MENGADPHPKAGTHKGTTGVAVVEDVFPVVFCRRLLDEARAMLRDGSGFPASNSFWQPSLQRGANPVRVHSFAEHSAKVISGFLRARGMLGEGDVSAMLHAWPVGSYIPWHNDAIYRGATTVYLNDRWEPEWGGHFLYRTSDEAAPGVVVPRFNLGLSNDSAVVHCTTPVAAAAPEPRLSLQVFLNAASDEPASGR